MKFVSVSTWLAPHAFSSGHVPASQHPTHTSQVVNEQIVIMRIKEYTQNNLESVCNLSRNTCGRSKLTRANFHCVCCAYHKLQLAAKKHKLSYFFSQSQLESVRILDKRSHHCYLICHRQSLDFALKKMWIDKIVNLHRKIPFIHVLGIHCSSEWYLKFQQTENRTSATRDQANAPNGRENEVNLSATHLASRSFS